MPFVEHNSNRMSGILVHQFSCHNWSFLLGWNMTLLRVALGMNLDRTVETFASIYYRWNKKFTPSIHWSRYPVTHSQTSSFHKIIYYFAEVSIVIFECPIQLPIMVLWLTLKILKLSISLSKMTFPSFELWFPDRPPPHTQNEVVRFIPCHKLLHRFGLCWKLQVRNM